MKATIVRCMVTVLSIWATSAAHADQYVVSHPGVTLSASEVSDVFLGEKQFAGSVKLVPVDNAAAQDQFLAKVLNMQKSKYSNVWTKKAFRDGLNQPATKASDNDVIEFVKRTPGGVGYVTSNPTGVKVIEKY